jgi:hypothetical protein
MHLESLTPKAEQEIKRRSLAPRGPGWPINNEPNWLDASRRTKLVAANLTPIGCLHRDLGMSRRMQKSILSLAPRKRVSFPFPASQARCMRVAL